MEKPDWTNWADRYGLTDRANRANLNGVPVGPALAETVGEELSILTEGADGEGNSSVLRERVWVQEYLRLRFKTLLHI